jgi:hypothetical protein
MMKTSEMAARVLEAIPSRRFWVKSTYHGGRGMERHCVLGAMDAAGIPQRDRNRFARAFQRVANSQWPERRWRKDGPITPLGIAAFNDHPDTRYADVRIVLEKLRADESA